MSAVWAISRSGSVPITYTLGDTDGNPITTATITASCYEDATGKYLDFDDLTFKASGWTTQWAAVAHVALGVYSRADIDLSAVANLSPSGRRLEIAQHVVNTTPSLDYYDGPDVAILDPAVTAISVGVGAGSTDILFDTMRASLAASGIATVGVYTPQGESAITMRALQQRPTVIVEEGGWPKTAQLDPMLYIRQDDLPNGVSCKSGDSWVAAGTTYTIQNPQPDGRGRIACELQGSPF